MIVPTSTKLRYSKSHVRLHHVDTFHHNNLYGRNGIRIIIEKYVESLADDAEVHEARRRNKWIIERALKQP